VAVIGNVDSGKSTLVGVLTRSMLDDGRGLARGKVSGPGWGHWAYSTRGSDGRDAAFVLVGGRTELRTGCSRLCNSRLCRSSLCCVYSP
jgi:sulfate adenylyltransferase subunit 1 (EFTu-like GTPase family)